MPRDGNGGYTLPAGNPVVAGTTITDAWANVTIADLANEIAGSMTIDGQTPLTGPLKFAAGTVTSPSFTFNVESNTGLYRPALQALGVTVNGSEKVRFTASAVQPGSNNTTTLGASGLRWSTVYATTVDATTVTATSVNGTTVTGTTVVGNVHEGAAGAAGTPSFAFTSETTTGLYRPATQTIGFSVNGTERARLTTSALQPGANNTYALGTSALRWSTVYATTFDGIATSARYADLAEKYRSDARYAVGTVVRVGGEHEITMEKRNESSKVFGVISSQPGFMLNSGAGEGTDEIWQYVALVGRVPVRVVGTVKKGDQLVSARNGCAQSIEKPSSTAAVIGVALEDKDTVKEGYVLVAVR